VEGPLGTLTDYAGSAAQRWHELDPNLDELRLRVGIRLERLARVHERWLNEALTEFGSAGVRNMEDFRLLVLLARISPEATSATAASRLLKLTKGATSARAERFVQEGLVEAKEREYDRRIRELRASDEGIALATNCIHAIAAVHSRILDQLGEEQLSVLDDLLLTITSRTE